MKKIFLISFILLFYVLNILLIFFSTQEANLRISGILTATFIYVLVFYLSIKLLRKSARLVNILFLNVIILIVMQGLINFDYFSKESKDENRVLADFPKLSPFHEDFAEKTDRYIDDRVGMRIQAGKAYSYIAKNDYDFNQRVVEGRDGWLFYNDENDDYDYFSGIKKFKQENIEKVIKTIKENKEFCDKNGMKLIIAIPPNKSTVYPEYYNRYVNKVDNSNNYLELRKIINENFNIPLIMPLEHLIEGKEEYQLYYKTDTHWTRAGAYLFYKDIAKNIKKMDNTYNLVPENMVEKNENKDKFFGDLRRMSKKFENESYYDTGYTEINTKYDNLLKLENKDDIITVKGYNQLGPKVLFIHDSFFEYMEPFFEYGVSGLGSLWVYESDFKKYKKEILKFKPDIIVWERLERYWMK